MLSGVFDCEAVSPNPHAVLGQLMVQIGWVTMMMIGHRFLGSLQVPCVVS